jgi:hypothetical protein
MCCLAFELVSSPSMSSRYARSMSLRVFAHTRPPPPYDCLRDRLRDQETEPQIRGICLFQRQHTSISSVTLALFLWPLLEARGPNRGRRGVCCSAISAMIDSVLHGAWIIAGEKHLPSCWWNS